MYSDLVEVCSKYISKVCFKMKNTGMIRQLDSLGRVVIPAEMRKNLSFEDAMVDVSIDYKEEAIVIEKIKNDKSCIITKENTKGNREYGNGIVLSERGARILLNEIEKKLSN